MPPILNADTFLAAFIGGWEITLILATVLAIFLLKRLPEMWRGLGCGLRQFWDITGEVTGKLNGTGFGAGRSIGGIYGKPAAEAIAHDNCVAEFYSVNDERNHGRAARLFKFLLRSLWSAIRWLLRTR